MDTMEELFVDFLQDIYYAEKQGLRGMARLIKAVVDPALKAAITEHRTLSENQIQRLDEVFAHFGKRPRGKKCAAMDGLLSEAQEQVAEGEKGPIRDCALLATSQAIEHYEIARYGALHAWATAMGMDEVAELIEQNLGEEKASDEKLNGIAQSLNREAAGGEEAADEEEEAEEEEVIAPEPAPAPVKSRGGRAKK